jgi:hypothetical protein
VENIIEKEFVEENMAECIPRCLGKAIPIDRIKKIAELGWGVRWLESSGWSLFRPFFSRMSSYDEVLGARAETQSPSLKYAKGLFDAQPLVSPRGRSLDPMLFQQHFSLSRG